MQKKKKILLKKINRREDQLEKDLASKYRKRIIFLKLNKPDNFASHYFGKILEYNNNVKMFFTFTLNIAIFEHIKSPSVLCIDVLLF